VLRLGAALAVVLFHTPTLGVGRFGVDMFFVISGIVMMMSTRSAANARGSLSSG